MAPEGCSATRCRRARVVGALLASTASLAAAGPAKASRRKLTGYVMDDGTIRTAVSAWLSDSAAAEATYGQISTWETSGVTDMSSLFCGTWWSECNTAAASFNEDISAWDTSGVTTMHSMFYYTSAFNQDIGAWAVDSVTDMNSMFYDAWAFDQDLGWCVDDGVFDPNGEGYTMQDAFSSTLCESTSCGVTQADGACAPSPAPTLSVAPTVTLAPTVALDDTSIRPAVAAWLSDRGSRTRRPPRRRTATSRRSPASAATGP